MKNLLALRIKYLLKTVEKRKKNRRKVFLKDLIVLFVKNNKKNIFMYRNCLYLIEKDENNFIKKL